MIEGKGKGIGPAEERLSRFLARSGIASRRHADELIAGGRVTVNGQPAVLGQKIRPGKDVVLVDGKKVGGAEKQVYIMLYKPPGYLSSCSDPRGRKTVLSLLGGVPERVYPVGRLDYDAEGLLLLTNDGELTYLLTHPRHRVVKEYSVWVEGPRDEGKIREILSGIIIGGKKVQVDYARFGGEKGRLQEIVIAVHEGQKHLVKHICHSVGYEVKRLKRLKIGPLSLGSLKKGEWRYLSPGQVEALYREARKGWEGERGR
ncbi:MAG TPA: rRNA pseudouridine synthase [Firmicutes bacterium]|nr:rRNA pseudouridine synthase [Candidatus Fermentithermobacillaceae bacterium]